ncbi:MAG: hypothetical protein ACYST0_14405, partial [Planctomycetota bacterium]
ISWANTAGNYSGYTDTTVQNSDGGFAGKNGNINTDPKFLGASTGDLRLQATSPCLGTADMAAALATKKDHDENSRIIDHGLTGAALPDMGAYERTTYTMKTSGQPALGQTLSMSVQGPPGQSKVFVGALNGQVFLPPFGMALLGTGPILLLGSGSVGTQWQVAIPNLSSLIGIRVGIQGIAATQKNLFFGATTNLWRIAVVAVKKR